LPLTLQATSTATGKMFRLSTWGCWKRPWPAVEYSHNIKAAIYAQLRQLSDSLAGKIGAKGSVMLNAATQAHTNYLDFTLRKALAVEK
jgi:hypothetical protein